MSSDTGMAVGVDAVLDAVGALHRKDEQKLDQYEEAEVEHLIKKTGISEAELVAHGMCNVGSVDWTPLVTEGACV